MAGSYFIDLNLSGSHQAFSPYLTAMICLSILSQYVDLYLPEFYPLDIKETQSFQIFCWQDEIITC